jgi:hypothetical protein
MIRKLSLTCNHLVSNLSDSRNVLLNQQPNPNWKKEDEEEEENDGLHD